MRSQALRTASRRVVVLRNLLLAVLLVLVVRAAYLAGDDRGLEQRIRQVYTDLEIPPARGAIVDREGRALVVSLSAPSVFVERGKVENPTRTARELARALTIDQHRLGKLIRGGDSYAFVKRWVSDREAATVAALDLPGVGIATEPRRAYPAGSLAGALLGFANIDGRGVQGIEQQEDAWLRGSAHAAHVERDGRGKILLEEGIDPGDTEGGDIALTIDASLQAQTEAALSEVVEKTGALGGVVVVLDPATGEIRSLAEAPAFDPSEFREIPFASTRSRGFLDAIEPGSTLKVFLVAGALEAGVIGPADEIDCGNGKLELPGKTIRDTHENGILDVTEVITVSSNVGAVRIAQRLGPDPTAKILRRFGFGSATGGGFPSESAGILRPASSWRPIDHATIAFGQGVAVTPVQLAAATAALANGGQWIRPHLVRARRAPRGKWQTTSPVLGDRVVSPEVAALVLEMMETVVGPAGTGRRAGLSNLRVAGKTGTAQKYDRESGTYSTSRYTAWFTGVAPADDPRLVITVALDEPRERSHHGGASAAPLFASVATAHLARLGIITHPQPVARLQELIVNEEAPPPSAEPGDSPLHVAARRPKPIRRTQSLGTAQPVSAPAPASPRGIADLSQSRELRGRSERILLPDLVGRSRAEVERITSRHALRLEGSGSGRAIAQEPAAGTVVAGGGTVHVRFAKGRGTW